MSLCTRKTTVCVSEQVRHKLACTVSEKSKDHESLDLCRRGIVLSTVQLLLSRSAPLFLPMHACCWFSFAAAHSSLEYQKMYKDC